MAVSNVIIERELVVVESNIDDSSPEIMASVIDKLIANGAKDAWITPIVMKKGRPGFLLSVLVDMNDLSKIEEIIFLETSTIGFREFPVSRKVLEREVEEIETEYGMVRVKISFFKGKIVTISPEYESCREVSKRLKIPVKVVYEAVYGKVSEIKKKF